MGKRRLELEVQTETIVLRGPAPGVSWCHECGNPSMKISVDHAAVLSGSSEMMIYRMVDEGRLHHAETADGRLRICLQSLLAMEGAITKILVVDKHVTVSKVQSKQGKSDIKQ